jgi:hypothetical protein
LAFYWNILDASFSNPILLSYLCLAQLKTLSVILKNLVDPLKSQDVKYRTLKLENPKLHAKVFHIVYIREDLLQQVFGFVSGNVTSDDGSSCLCLSLAHNNESQAESTTTALLQTCLTEMEQARAQLVAASVSAPTNSTTNSQAWLTAPTTNKKARLVDQQLDKLSEKQKANRMMEEKEKVEKLKAKEERKRNLALLKTDKLARETDPNWKAGVSAACAKTGSGIQTFRDRHGEGE